MKKVAVILLALLLSVSLYACDDGKENPTPAATTAAKETAATAVAPETTVEETTTAEETTAAEVATTAAETEAPAENTGDIRPEIKGALDSYEEFFKDYCDFMNKYAENPYDLTLLAEYAEFMAQYTDTMEKMDSLDDGSLNDAEMAYYLEVTGRITQMLLEVAE